MSMPLLGFHLEAIYHTAIVYNGVEFYFGGGGIDQSRPGGTHLGAPMRKVKLGKVSFQYLFFSLSCLSDRSGSLYFQRMDSSNGI